MPQGCTGGWTFSPRAVLESQYNLSWRGLWSVPAYYWHELMFIDSDVLYIFLGPDCSTVFLLTKVTEVQVAWWTSGHFWLVGNGKKLLADSNRTSSGLQNRDFCMLPLVHFFSTCRVCWFRFLPQGQMHSVLAHKLSKKILQTFISRKNSML